MSERRNGLAKRVCQARKLDGVVEFLKSIASNCLRS